MIVAHSAPLQHLALSVVAVLCGAAYLRAWSQLGRPRLRSALCFVGGTAGLLLATAPPAERMAERTFTGHMVQHLALLAVAAPLLVLSHPVETLAATRRWSRHRWWRRLTVVRARVGWLVPPLAWVALVGSLYGTHLTGFYDAALRHQAVHDLEHGTYLAAGLLLWSAVVGHGAVRAPARAALAAGTMAPVALLGVVLTSASQPLSASYQRRLGTAEALADQRAGASLMWVGAMLSTLPLVMWSVYAWAAREHRQTVRREAIQDALARAE